MVLVSANEDRIVTELNPLNQISTNALQTFMLLKTAQAADIAGTTERMFQEMRRTGRGPKYVRLSRKIVRYRLCDLLEWIEASLKTSTSEH
jgi:hypothetical protein